ncbi:MAG: Crp/Fnr family transcriptional regulator, partial [Pseudomonadota bacterium]
MSNDFDPSLAPRGSSGGSGEPAVCAACAVRNSSLCGALSSDEINELNKLSRRKSLDPGQTYVFEGDKALDFANVVQGVAKLTRGAEDGRLQIVGLLFPSDFIGGSMALGHGSDRKAEEPYTIEAVSPLELCIFPRAGFEKLLMRFPALEHKLLDRTLTELQVAREWMVLLGRKTAQERVATFILHVAEKMRNHGCHSSLGFDLPLGRGDIADHIGLTIETVSRQITQLKRKGIIDMQGARHVRSYDLDAL